MNQPKKLKACEPFSMLERLMPNKNKKFSYRACL